MTKTLLTIDRSGSHSGDGTFDRSWAGVVLVWVGSGTGLRVPPVGDVVISLFTASGIDFAHRAGTSPKAVVSIPVGRSFSVSELCERLRTVTDALVVDGTRVSRRRASAQL